MVDWIFPSNPNNIFDVKGAFAQNNGYVDWTKGTAKVKEGDTAYLYASSPVKSIIAITTVEKINITDEERLNEDDFWIDEDKKERANNSSLLRLKLLRYLSGKEFTFPELQKHGLTSTVQSKIKPNKKLSVYLSDSVTRFKKAFEWIDFHESLSQAFLDYKDNREEFNRLVKNSFKVEGFSNPFDGMKEAINPLSVFYAISMDIEWNYKKHILSNLKDSFSLTTPVCDSYYRGIPFSEDIPPFINQDTSQKMDDNLWRLLKLIVPDDNNFKTNDIIKLYDEILQSSSSNVNLPLLMYLAQPRKFLALDAAVENQIIKYNNQIHSDKNYEGTFETTLSGKDYFELLNDIKKYLQRNTSVSFSFPTFFSFAHEINSEKINYQLFYDFKPYHGQKYIDPNKSKENQAEMVDFKEKGQRAREEFQKVINLLDSHIENKSIDIVTNWINQGQVGNSSFWTFIRDLGETKSTPAIAISLSDISNHIQWTMQVDVLDYQIVEDKEGFIRQNKVLNVPLGEQLYYWVEDFSG